MGGVKRVCMRVCGFLWCDVVTDALYHVQAWRTQIIFDTFLFCFCCTGDGATVRNYFDLVLAGFYLQTNKRSLRDSSSSSSSALSSHLKGDGNDVYKNLVLPLFLVLAVITVADEMLLLL